MKTKLNAGIIGLGSISRVHLAALKDMPQAHISAVCDIDPAKLASAKDATGADAYEDWRELIKRNDLDIIHVLTPHYLHAPMSIAALKAGRHVLTEKPMASETEDALEMIRVSDTARGTLNVIFQNRYNASTVELKRIIESGETGELIGARAMICWHRIAPYYTNSGWRGRWDTEGGGALINQSIHTLDLLSYLGGPIRRVKGHISTDLLADAIEVEDNAHAVFEYESGATGVIYATTNYSLDAPIVLEMAFEKATYQLWAEKLFKVENGVPCLVAQGEDAKELGEKSYWGASHKIRIRKVYDSILAGKRSEIDGRSAFGALALVKGIYESSRTGDWAVLPKPDIREV